MTIISIDYYYAECRYAECRNYLNVMLSVITVNVLCWVWRCPKITIGKSFFCVSQFKLGTHKASKEHLTIIILVGVLVLNHKRNQRLYF
jgi:hypothetical protein